MEKGNLGIGYNVSLALERILGMGEEPPSKGYVIDNTTLSISLGVLIKDTLSYIDKKESNRIIIKQDTNTMTKLLDTELEALTSLLPSFTAKGLKCIVHLTPYKHIEEGNTLIIKRNELIAKVEKMYISEFKEYQTSDLLMTNNPFDMLKLPISSYVLNTHTGDLLSKRELSKKLKKGGSYDTSNFPLVESTISIFGDCYGYYKGASIRVKREAAKLLTDKKVTPKSTEFEIRNILKRGKLI